MQKSIAENVKAMTAAQKNELKRALDKKLALPKATMADVNEIIVLMKKLSGEIK